MIRKIIITGGPHTGKTSLFEGLKPILPNAGFVTEPATSVLARLGGRQALKSPQQFCELCIEVAVADEAETAASHELLIQDRSLIDTVAYARRDGSEELLPSLYEKIQAAHYTGAFVCDFVGIYANSDTRSENRQQAIDTHNLTIEAYKESGLPLFYLPAAPLEQRVLLAAAALHSEFAL